MQNNADIAFRDNQFYVTGDLDFSNVMSVWQKSLVLFANQSSLTLNFSELATCNSAALALVMEWVRFAKDKEIMIDFKHFPSRLQAIAVAAGVSDFLN